MRITTKILSVPVMHVQSFTMIRITDSILGHLNSTSEQSIFPRENRVIIVTCTFPSALEILNDYLYKGEELLEYKANSFQLKD